ncbi:hypothetical protein CRG98_010162 [Punica granatum]|uniref:Uncharacterized protein n=1 Tax=Punica granatum TaxID=22663 RepID=A0A2I0KLY1_PUNGR|nr:hypothetical protein CRG98_010162 [Punica granatum]
MKILRVSITKLDPAAARFLEPKKLFLKKYLLKFPYKLLLKPMISPVVDSELGVIGAGTERGGAARGRCKILIGATTRGSVTTTNATPLSHLTAVKDGAREPTHYSRRKYPTDIGLFLTVHNACAATTDPLGPNCASSNSTPPLGYGLTVDPNTWVPSTHVLEGGDMPTIHVSVVHLVNTPPPPTTFPIAITPPLTVVLTSNPTMFALPPMSIPVSTPIYLAPLQMVFSAPSAHAPAYTTEPFPFQTLQPHNSLPYQAPSLLNIPIPKPGKPTHAVPITPSTNSLPKAEIE